MKQVIIQFHVTKIMKIYSVFNYLGFITYDIGII